MKRILLAFTVLLFLMPNTVTAKNKTVRFRVIETSDVHGSFFPYDFINRKAKEGSMARVMTYVREQRKTYGDHLILLDNGDILQGQPSCYYYNFIKTDVPNVAAQVINYMGYNAQVFGNHDVEPGHAVYDKWISDVKCPVLGANIIDTKTGQPYVMPYTIIEREGVKIAILGMLTPAIPNWLSEKIWSGLRFDEMVSSARYWMQYIQEHEHPAVVIGLFHSGKDGGIVTEQYEEDASVRVAREVPGFDLVLYGHDHTLHTDLVKNTAGKDVLCLDPSCNAIYVADAQIEIVIGKRHRVISKQVKGELVKVTGYEPDAAFMSHFQPVIDEVNTFVNRKIGEFEATICTRDCYFGNSAFADFIHDFQLKATGADISFNAPLSFNACISAGPLYVSDMFNLYRYENELYVLKMTGEEVRKHLEMSYDLWVNTMTSPEDHIMLLNESESSDQQRFRFKNLAFNFDSGSGIDYEVDVTKPDGQKVRILRMSNGEPFVSSKMYKVAMNSYRAQGGGELLTRGAGLSIEEINRRTVYQSGKDLRYCLMQEIEKTGHLNPHANHNWRFVPEEWAKPAIERDRALLFGKE